MLIYDNEYVSKVMCLEFTALGQMLAWIGSIPKFKKCIDIWIESSTNVVTIAALEKKSSLERKLLGNQSIS